MTRPWIDDVLERAERALARAGVACWELAASEVRSAGAEVMDGEVEVVETSVERSVGIRVLDGGVGFAGATEPRDVDLDEAVAAAVGEARRARSAAIRAFASLAETPAPTPQRFVDPRATGRVRIGLVERALALEAEALRAPKIARVRPARIDEERGLFRLRTSSGLDVSEDHSRASASIGAVAEDDEDTQSSYAFTSGASLEGLVLDVIAREAAEDAAGLLGAAGFETGRVPVVFGPGAAAELVELLVGALDAARVERGATFLAGRLGERIVSPALTIVDDPHDATLDGCAAFDGEGLATIRNVLFDRGVVASYLDDRESAARAGRRAPSLAVRGAASHRPHPGVHNLAVLPGDVPPAELMRRAEGGLWVHELSGSHTMNEITGELSLGATGWAIRGAARAEPVQGVTVAGTLLAMLSGAITLSSEIKRLGAVGVPAILVDGVMVSA
ncbi:TldD/PmbA family protein [Myxococcota bacterium]|nr:TldD/PmbA family protein [Myxococcota bacterium]